MPSSSARPSSRASERAGYSRIRIIPSPRSTSRCGEPSVSRQRKNVLSRGSSPKWRSPKRLHPLAQRLLGGGDEHHPHVLGGSLGERARHRQQRRHPGRVVVGARETVAAQPMSASAAAESRARARRSRLRSGRGCRSATPARSPAGDRRPRAAIRGGLVSHALDQPREAPHDRLGDRGVVEQAGSAPRRGGRPGRRCARRPPGPSSRDDLVVARPLGQQRAQPPAPGRQVVDGGRAGGRRPSVAPSTRRPRRAATPATTPAPAARPSGHQKVPWAVLGLDPRRRRPARASSPSQPFRRPPLARRGRGAVDRGQRLDQIAAANPGRDAARLRARPALHRWPSAAKPTASYLRWVHAGARHDDSVSRPGDPDRGRLLVVLRPLPDHPLAVELLPLRARRLQRRRRPLPARAGQRARLLRLDPAARAGPRLRRHAPRDRHLRHHPVDVRRRRADDAGLRLAGHRVQGGDRRPAGHPGDRARLRRQSGSPPPARTSSGRRCESRRGPTRPGSWR